MSTVVLDSSNYSTGVAIQVDGVDDEAAGVTVTVTDAMTDEAGGTATVQFSLASQPGDAVTIPLSVDDATEGSLGAVTEIVIDSSDWDDPSANTVTITGVDDATADDVDGDQTYGLVTGDPTSEDRAYTALGAADVADPAITNTDLDTAADLSVTSGGSLDLVAGGSAGALEFSVVNNGPSAASAVVLDIDLPTGVTLAPAASSLVSFDSCTAATGGATCAIGAVPNGETVEVSLDVIVADPTADETTLSAAAAVSTDTTDPTAANDAASGSIVVSRSTDLSVVASATTDASGRPGFDLTVQNAGPSTGGAQVTFVLPDGVTLASTTDAACVATGTSVECDVAALAADGSVVVSVVLDGEVAGGDITISLGAAFNDGNASDNASVVELSASVVTTTTVPPTTAPPTTMSPTTVPPTTVPTPSSDLPATGSSGSDSLLWFGLLALLAGAALTLGVRRKVPSSTN